MRMLGVAALSLMCGCASLAHGVPVMGVEGIVNLAVQPDDDLARSTVFEVSVQYPGAQVGRLVQPGFLVGAGGVGITSYNALHGAATAQAVFAGSEGTYKVVVLRAEPSLDLALIRLEPQEGTEAALDTFLSLAPGDIRDREPVWTLKSSVVLDETKAVPGIVEVSSQNIGRNPGLAFDAPGWITGNLYQDRHTSGCPMVDERGRLVGIQVWSWPGSSSRPVGLTARVVDDLLAGYEEDCRKASERGQPAPAFAVSDVRRQYQGKKLIGSIFPRMEWTSSRAESANMEAKRLAQNLMCTTCEGTGKGEAKPRSKREPIAPRTPPCAACEGNKFLPKEKFEAVVGRAARTIAGVPQGTEAYDTLLKNLHEGAAACMSIDSRVFQGRLTEVARVQLDPERMKRGEVVMFVGTLSRQPALSNWDAKAAIVRPAWDAKASVLALSPDDGGKLDSNQQALIIGVVSGFVTIRPHYPYEPRQEMCIVLDRVTAVPLKAGVR